MIRLRLYNPSMFNLGFDVNCGKSFHTPSAASDLRGKNSFRFAVSCQFSMSRIKTRRNRNALKTSKIK